MKNFGIKVDSSMILTGKNIQTNTQTVLLVKSSKIIREKCSTQLLLMHRREQAGAEP